MPPGISTTMTMKRIHREIADLKKEDLGPIVLEPSDNLYMWKGSLPGPQGSVYEGGTFLVEIQLPNDYPFSAPKVVFKTRIYHMNISEQGGICIDILKHNWSPALSLFKVMLSLSSLLTDPNPKDPLVPSVATQYVRNRHLHDDTARRWTDMYARTVALVAPKLQTPASMAPMTPAAQPPAPKSNKAKGKKRDNAAPSSSHIVAGSSNSNRSQSDEVIILKSDDEDSGPKEKKRKRPSGGLGATGDSVGESELIDLVDSEEEREAEAAAKKRTRTMQRRKPMNTRTASGTGGADSSGTRRSSRLGDVIVIED